MKAYMNYSNEDKNHTEKYFRGSITLMIVGFIAFLIAAIQPMANFVNDTNTDIFTLISLGLVLVTISVKQGIYNSTNRPALPAKKLEIKTALKN